MVLIYRYCAIFQSTHRKIYRTLLNLIIGMLIAEEVQEYVGLVIVAD